MRKYRGLSSNAPCVHIEKDRNNEPIVLTPYGRSPVTVASDGVQACPPQAKPSLAPFTGVDDARS
jgi:hypothetical protein